MELEAALPSFEERDIGLFAISMDNQHQAGEMAAASGASFLLLADPRGKTVKEYGVYNLLEDGVAAPATFIISRDGVVLWSHVGQNIGDRPTPEEILLVLGQLRAQGA